MDVGLLVLVVSIFWGVSFLWSGLHDAARLRCRLVFAEKQRAPGVDVSLIDIFHPRGPLVHRIAPHLIEKIYTNFVSGKEAPECQSEHGLSGCAHIGFSLHGVNFGVHLGCKRWGNDKEGHFLCHDFSLRCQKGLNFVNSTKRVTFNCNENLYGIRVLVHPKKNRCWASSSKFAVLTVDAGILSRKKEKPSVLFPMVRSPTAVRAREIHLKSHYFAVFIYTTCVVFFGFDFLFDPF